MKINSTLFQIIALAGYLLFVTILIDWMLEGYWARYCTAFTGQAQTFSEYINLGNYLACRK